MEEEELRNLDGRWYLKGEVLFVFKFGEIIVCLLVVFRREGKIGESVIVLLEGDFWGRLWAFCVRGRFDFRFDGSFIIVNYIEFIY